MTGLIDHLGRPLSSSNPSIPLGVLNENAFHWTRYTPEIYYNPDNISLETYERMYNTDETVFSGIEFLVMAALSRLGEYTHEDRKIEDFVRRQLVEMDGAFPKKVADIMTAAPFGFSATEIIWKVTGREVGIQDLQTLHPATLHLDLHREGPLKNKPRAVYQFYQQDHQVEIPLKKCILYSHGTSFGNAYGVSRLKRAYKSWYIKDIILKAWAITCQRYGTPYTIGKTNDKGQVSVGGQQINKIDHLMNVLDSFGQTGSAVVGLEDVIETIYAGTGYGDDFENLVAYCNKMIYRAIGLPSLIADHGKTGSYSLGKQHYTLFIQVLEDLFFETMDTILEQLIRPLIELNFGPQANGYGMFAIEEYKVEDAKVLAETANLLASSGICNFANIEDVNHWRERIGLPLITEEELESSAPPAIEGLESQQQASSTDASTDAEIVEELQEMSRRDNVLNFSNKARIAAQREMRRRTNSRASVDRLASQLAQFSRTV